MTLLILLGLPVGLAFDFASQRGRFCINSAFRDPYLIRDTTLLRTFVLAVLIQMVGVQLLLQLELIQVWVVEFFWLASIVGGLVKSNVIRNRAPITMINATVLRLLGRSRELATASP